MSKPGGNPAGFARPLLAATGGLLLIATLLGLTANLVRPRATRLPWSQDWSRHIESLAYQANIPVAFLLSARERIADPATVVFDARTPEEYAAGHIAGAFSMPVADAETAILAHAHRLTPSSPILVYCGSSACTDALDLATLLRALGFDNITLYPGGYAEWTEYNGTTATGVSP